MRVLGTHQTLYIFNFNNWNSSHIEIMLTICKIKSDADFPFEISFYKYFRLKIFGKLTWKTLLGFLKNIWHLPSLKLEGCPVLSPMPVITKCINSILI